MANHKKKEADPTFTKKGAWLWLFCAPIALVISAHYESKKDMEKWRKKRHERAVYHWDGWWS